MVAVVVVCRFVHHHAQPAVCHLYNFRLDLYGGHTSDGSCICCNCDAVAEDGKFCLASLLYTSHIDVSNAGKVHEHASHYGLNPLLRNFNYVMILDSQTPR